MNDIRAIFPHTLKILGLPIRDTVLQTWVVVAILLGLAAWARPRLRLWQPRGWQMVVEWLIDYVEDLVRNMGGVPEAQMTSYLVTLIVFVVLSNLLGLLPTMRAPTRDLNTTVALAMISLGSCYFYGIRERGFWSWLRSFVEPVPVLLPLNVLNDVMRVVSMALRLFGNIIAGEMLSAVMYMLVPLVAPLLFNALGAVTGVLQALVFTILTIVAVLQAMGKDEASDAISSEGSTLQTSAAGSTVDIVTD